MNIVSLLQELEAIFDHRPTRLSLRKKFEDRTWKVSEAFAEYFHEKLVLANALSLEEEEIIDYVIDGVLDTQIQN